MGNNKENTNKDAKDTSNERPKSLRRSWNSSGPVAKWTVRITAIGAGATLIYAFVAAWQLVALRGQLTALQESNEINRESLVSVQRAFVTLRQIEQVRTVTREGNRDVHYWIITPIVENGGTTPAIKAINYTFGDWLLDEPYESQFIGTTKNFTYSTTIGPKAQQGLAPMVQKESSLFDLDLGDLTRIQLSHPPKPFFVWGWVAYLDVFPTKITKPHVTEFCSKLVNAQFVYSNPRSMRWNMTMCKAHNCTDDSCDDYQTISDMVPR